jgi:hypothetical protein
MQSLVSFRGGMRSAVGVALAILSTAVACGPSAPGTATTGGGGGTGAPGGPVCPGSDPPPAGYATCRQEADCKGLSCLQSVPSQPGCGVLMGATTRCASDADCGPGSSVCEPYTVPPGPCTIAPYDGTQCTPPCTSTSCAADQQCLASGHCQPIPCTQGYTCAAGLVCKVGDAAADPHGCAPLPCTQGYTCAAGLVCQPDPLVDVHGCAPQPCSQGYTCPAGTTCGGSSITDPHGCSPIHCSATHPCPVNTTCNPAGLGDGCTSRRCTHDAECDCGACVSGFCADHVGICVDVPE